MDGARLWKGDVGSHTVVISASFEDQDSNLVTYEKKIKLVVKDKPVEKIDEFSPGPTGGSS